MSHGFRKSRWSQAWMAAGVLGLLVSPAALVLADVAKEEKAVEKAAEKAAPKATDEQPSAAKVVEQAVEKVAKEAIEKVSGRPGAKPGEAPKTPDGKPAVAAPRQPKPEVKVKPVEIKVEKVDAKTTLDAFVRHVTESKDFSDEQRKAVLDQIKQAREEDETSTRIITDALTTVYPNLREALLALGDEDTATAIPTLEALVKSDDAFLKADAQFYLARAYMIDERHEESVPLLEAITSGPAAHYTLGAADALFLRGVALTKLLKRGEAMGALAAYLESHPQAPERLRIGAWHQLEELKAMTEGSLVDVEGRMDYSRRRLTLERSDKPTQTEQAKIIAMLDQLIEEAEQKEKDCNCKGGGKGGKGKKKGRGGAGSGGGPGGSAPGSGAIESAAGLGQSETGPLSRVSRGKADEQWGGLKDKKRDEVLSGLKGKYPPQYKELVEKYYKSLQEEDEK